MICYISTFLNPRSTGGGYTVLPLSVLPSVRPSVLPSVQDIFRRIFLSNYWWQRTDIWSQASYRYPILWEVFFDPSDSYFLFAEEQVYHRWALAHSSSCFCRFFFLRIVNLGTEKKFVCITGSNKWSDVTINNWCTLQWSLEVKTYLVF